MRAGKSSDVRITPPVLVERVRAFAGARSLVDVCTEPDNPAGADSYWTASDDALMSGRVWARPGLDTAWCNPPWSRGQIVRWVSGEGGHPAGTCVLAQARAGAEILLLTVADCRTGWHRTLVENCDARCQLYGSVGFLEPVRDIVDERLTSESGRLTTRELLALPRQYRQLPGYERGVSVWYFGARRRRFAAIWGEAGEIIHGLGPQEEA